MVARRRQDRLLERSGWLDGFVGARAWQRHRAQDCAARDVGSVVARRRTHRLSRSRIATARRRRVERPGPEGARSAERAWAPELVSRWSCDRDVSAAHVLDEVSRGYEPGAAHLA